MRAMILLSLLGCASVRKHADLVLTWEANAVIICDHGQTQWMANGGRYDRGLQELNPVLGRTPSTTRIAVTNLAALVGNTAVHYANLLTWLKLTIHVSVAIIETANV